MHCTQRASSKKVLAVFALKSLKIACWKMNWMKKQTNSSNQWCFYKKITLSSYISTFATKISCIITVTLNLGDNKYLTAWDSCNSFAWFGLRFAALYRTIARVVRPFVVLSLILILTHMQLGHWCFIHQNIKIEIVGGIPCYHWFTSWY